MKATSVRFVTAPTVFCQTASISMLLLLAACRSAPPPRPTPAMDQKKPAYQGTIHVGDSLGSPKNCGMVHGVRPDYPKEAKKAHLEGVVKLNIVVTKTSEVGEIHLVSGDPVLVPAAIKAVGQWQFAPCRLNGEPIEIKTQVDVPFTLSH